MKVKKMTVENAIENGAVNVGDIISVTGIVTRVTNGSISVFTGDSIESVFSNDDIIKIHIKPPEPINFGKKDIILQSPSNPKLIIRTLGWYKDGLFSAVVEESDLTELDWWPGRSHNDFSDDMNWINITKTYKEK